MQLKEMTEENEFILMIKMQFKWDKILANVTFDWINQSEGNIFSNDGFDKN